MTPYEVRKILIIAFLAFIIVGFLTGDITVSFTHISS